MKIIETFDCCKYSSVLKFGKICNLTDSESNYLVKFIDMYPDTYFNGHLTEEDHKPCVETIYGLYDYSNETRTNLLHLGKFARDYSLEYNTETNKITYHCWL